MARARNIKPGFFKSYELADLGPECQLLFAGLWCLADRAGRLEDKPRYIKAEVFPYYECDVDEALDMLASSGFVRRYEVDGVDVVEILNFLKHQSPHHTEKASGLPAFPGENEPPVKSPCEDGGNRPDSLIPDSLIPDSLIPSPPIAGQAGEESDRPKKGDYTPEFEEAYAEYPSRPGASKADSFKAWRARIKAGVEPAQMLDGVRRYAAYCTACKTEPNFIKQPATFFGPGEHYTASWEAPAGAAVRGAKPSSHAGFDKVDYRKGINDDGTFA